MSAKPAISSVGMSIRVLDGVPGLTSKIVEIFARILRGIE
jgi:hypothetical protein